MTIQECYLKLHGSYCSAKRRLMSDALITKFLLKFPADPSMEQLVKAVEANDRKEAFIAVHTLKGVAANLGFMELQECASELTEQLRDGQQDPDLKLFEAVKQAYDLVVKTIHEFE